MWRYNHTYPPELYHHGIKGMKWGVRRTPEQLGYRKKGLQNPIVGDMIKSGKVSARVNPEKQRRHIPGSREYTAGRSVFWGTVADAQRMINELSGTGEPVMVKNKWIQQERVSASNIIGVYNNPKTGKSMKTNKAMIVYSKTGAHIYPGKPTKEV